MTGADRITRALRRARDEHRLGFVPYLTAGDPDLDWTRRLTAALAGAGADILELGVPWIRLAVDGPVMPRKTVGPFHVATDLDAVLTSLPVIKSSADLPVVLASDLDPILQLGEETFAERAEAVGVDGLLLVDFPGERAERARAVLESRGLAAVFLVTADSTDERLRAIARAGSGFVHTASSAFLEDKGRTRSELLGLAARVGEQTGLPVAAGFGVSSAKQVAALRDTADAFVAGNSLVAIVERLGATDGAIEAVTNLSRKLLEAGRND
jgi:tryptophan synthase alpha chain